MDTRNPVFTADGRVDVEIDHPEYGWIPFTADPNDPVEFGRDLHASLIAAGGIAPYVLPAPMPESPALYRKDLLVKALTESEAEALALTLTQIPARSRFLWETAPEIMSAANEDWPTLESLLRAVLTGERTDEGEGLRADQVLDAARV